MENSKSRIAANIREAREWKKITQVGMARQLGIARQTYLDLESGKTEPRVSTLVSVAEITGRPLSWFVYEGEGPVSHNEQEGIQQLLALFAQVPCSIRASLIEHNINFVSCWVDHVSAIKRK